MSILEPYADESQSATERLLETSWEGRERRASERELIVEASAAALFVVAAAVLVLSWGAAGLRLPVAALLIGVYAVVGRIEFPVGAGFVVPTQLILVPMLLLLPPGRRAGRGGDRAGQRQRSCECALGRVPPRRHPVRGPRRLARLGPALVLLVAGSPRIGLRRSCRCSPRRSPPGASSTSPARWCACGWPAWCPTSSSRCGSSASSGRSTRRWRRSGSSPRMTARQGYVAILFAAPARVPAVAAGPRPQPAHRPGPPPPQARRAGAGPAADGRAPPGRRVRRQARARRRCWRSCCDGSVEALDADAGTPDADRRPGALALLPAPTSAVRALGARRRPAPACPIQVGEARRLGPRAAARASPPRRGERRPGAALRRATAAPSRRTRSPSSPS